MNSLEVVKLEKKYFNDVLKLKAEYVHKLDLDQLNKIVVDDAHEIFLLKEKKELIGYIESSTIMPESEIYSILVSEQFQGKGYGSYLLSWFMNNLKERKCMSIFLEVNKINIKAINLYKKFGFVVYGERKKYYGDNDAILMRYDF